MRRLLLSISVLLLAACGSPALTTPSALPLKTYAAGVKKLSFEMISCSDPCAKYEAATCATTVDATAKTIEADISVGYEIDASIEDCPLSCGRPVLAHCEVPPLAAGTWTVTSGGFEATITVR